MNPKRIYRMRCTSGVHRAHARNYDTVADAKTVADLECRSEHVIEVSPDRGATWMPLPTEGN